MAFPTVSVEFSPTTGPFDTPTWISLSDAGPHGNRVLELEWTDGKQADLAEFGPGEATIVLSNHDRLFDPEHAAGTYFGDLNPRVPFRIRATERYNVLVLSGSANAWASTPDVTALDVTGDLDIRLRMAATDWTPAAVSVLMQKLNPLSGTAGGYELGLNAAGTIYLKWSDGAAFKTRTSTVATGIANGAVKWIRATLDVDNGAAGHDVRFYLSDDGVTWAQLGTTVTTAGTTSIGNSSVLLALGADIFGNNRLTGDVYRLEVRDGIDGTRVADFDADHLSSGQTTIIDDAGRVWTLQAATAVATRDGTAFDQFYGFVEDGWEQTTSPPAAASCTVKLVDLIGILNGYTLPSVLEAELVADSPIGYWPLDEQGGTVMRDRSGFDRDGEYRDGTVALSAERALSSGIAYRGIDFDGEHEGIVSEIEAAIAGRPFTIFGLIQIPFDGVTTNDGVILRCGSGNPGNSATSRNAEVGYTATANGLDIVGQARDGDADDAVAASDNAVGLTAPCVFTFRRAAAGAAQMWVDGVDETDINSTSAAAFASHPGVSIGSESNVAGGQDALVGWLAHVAFFDTDLGTARIAELADIAAAPLNGLSSGDHIEWALGQIGVPASMYDLDAGVAIMGPADTEGRDALAFMREVAATEQGDLYVAHHDGGKLRFRDRYASFQDTRSTVTQVTFSDDGTVADSTACRVIPGTLQEEANGIASVINRAAVSWDGGEEVVDDSAGSPYGPRSASVSTHAPTPGIARDLGHWITSLNATPRTRVRALGIDPGANHAEFPTALGTRIGDRAAYRSHPQEAGSATTRNLEVLGRHHVVSDIEWRSTFYLTEAADQGVDLFTLGASELGDPDILAY